MSVSCSVMVFFARVISLSRSLMDRSSFDSLDRNSAQSLPRVSFWIVASSSSERNRVSSSAVLEARNRFWRSMLSNCRSNGAVLDWMSVLSASALRIASCHRFRTSEISCRRASSRTPASRSVVRSFFSRSPMTSLCSRRMDVFSCWASWAADLRVSLISRFSSFVSATCSLSFCWRDRMIPAFSSASARADSRSDSSFSAWDSPFRADARDSFRSLHCPSRSATLFRASSFAWASRYNSSVSARLSDREARTDFSIADCL
mmetsp:Transcript_14967/g.30850  ORF Transcript_14967/g.30850 Transcript_14967/m.30850 type:complete len:261 (+) Transcript_14967:1821-2603(+)